MTFETVNLGYAKNTPNQNAIGRKMNEKLTDLMRSTLKSALN
jgi:hypothetical protein